MLLYRKGTIFERWALETQCSNTAYTYDNWTFFSVFVILLFWYKCMEHSMIILSTYKLRNTTNILTIYSREYRYRSNRLWTKRIFLFPLFLWKPYGFVKIPIRCALYRAFTSGPSTETIYLFPNQIFFLSGFPFFVVHYLHHYICWLVEVRTNTYWYTSLLVIIYIIYLYTYVLNLLSGRQWVFLSYAWLLTAVGELFPKQAGIYTHYFDDFKTMHAIISNC